MTCPHCHNEDEKMMERVSICPITFLCKVCSKTWRAEGLKRL